MTEEKKFTFPFVVVDIETTGLSWTQNEIIEIGAVRYSEDGSVETFSRFIKPVQKVPLIIYKLTNIKEDDLKHSDKVNIVLKEFSSFIKEEDIIVCHNADFDIKFLNHHLEKNKYQELRNRILDTLTLSRIFLPFLNNHKLSSIAEYFEINLENAHRAIYDAQITGQILLKLTEFVIQYVKPDEINFLVTVAEYTVRQEKGVNRFNYKEKNDYLLAYLTLLRDYMVKYALLRKSTEKNPYTFTHYNFIENPLSNEITGFDENKSKSNPEIQNELDIDKIFGEAGLFAKSFENYELRTGQIEMSKAVLTSFEKEEYLLVEAGTGVGKSLAYLIPSLLFSLKTKKKIVVSTNTKNLQEQLLFKDLPLIMKAVEMNFLAVLVKGRENYLCMRKWQEIYESMLLNKANLPFSPSEAQGLLYLFLWVVNTKTGDITENQAFHNTRFGFLWKRLASDRHLCLGRKCRFNNKCFLMEVRAKAEKANLLIINHSLLFSDIQNEQPTLGEIEYLVIDEAHNLLQSTSNYLGLSLSYPDILGFLNTIFQIRSDFQYGMIVNLKNNTMRSAIPETDKTNMIKSIESLTDYMKESKDVVETPFRLSGEIVKEKGAYNKFRIKKVEENTNWILSLKALQEYLKKITKELKHLHNNLLTYEAKKFPEQDTMLDFLSRTSDNLIKHIQNLDELIEPNINNYAYWLSSLDIQSENYPTGVFNYAPIRVNNILPDILYRKIKSLIFTSATLSLRNRFKFFVDNMGLDRIQNSKLIKQNNPPSRENGEGENEWSRVVNEKIVLSPFDYDKQTLILNTEFLPNVADAYFLPQSKDLIKAILEINKVGTLILFTARKDLEAIHDGIEQVCFENDILLLAQKGSSGRSSILNQFIHDGKAVLLGTNSFWEGVDVQGESLELLILHKLPFQPPTDPIVEALLEKLDSEGKNSFMHFSLPVALLRMRQGVGRLIRSKTDKGVILILDNRITTKYYGSYFKEIIPTKIYSTKNPVETIDAITKKLKFGGRHGTNEL
ncbi:MAG: exonuclease domain-containing protein [Candidatus Cloacimonetes bacterium]|nr:exonuclease domain-containing protein [Candidatus Cloacimonadota bacterium]